MTGIEQAVAVVELLVAGALLPFGLTADAVDGLVHAGRELAIAS